MHRQVTVNCVYSFLDATNPTLKQHYFLHGVVIQQIMQYAILFLHSTSDEF